MVLVMVVPEVGEGGYARSQVGDEAYQPVGPDVLVPERQVMRKLVHR